VPPFFRAIFVNWIETGDAVSLEADAAEHLGVAPGDEIIVLPLDKAAHE
jgi:hypothetical protein